MRTIAALPLVLLLGLGSTGCYDLFSDELILRQEGNDYLVGSGGSGGAGGATTTTIDPGCIPSQTPNPVRGDCGVFVSSSKGKPGNAGSKDAPLATIADALKSPKTGPVYLCAETFAESVQIGGGVTIYGGLDCTGNDWKWSGSAKSTVSPAAGSVPLVVEPDVGVVIEDVAFVAKDAAEAGGSSIAVIATAGADVELTRCVVEAGHGKDGAAGEAFGSDAAAGMMGNAGLEACSAAIVVPGAGVTNACDEVDPNGNSISGIGGVGTESSGGNGSSGQPDGAMNFGIGEGAMACTPGTAGDDGGKGASGAGAQGSGTISAQGYLGFPGTPGEKGKPGQGGGGGGGAKGGTLANQCIVPNAGGASGGSGGAGGCGGAGGKGGGAGGSSIGIVSLGADFTLREVTITAKSGGKGGAGGAGQNGGMGGLGGAGGSKGAASMLKDGCSGGPGGKGGLGGTGGGGLGGHSIAIAHTGPAAPDTTGVQIKIGSAGSGGTGDADAGKGANGVAKEVQAF